MINKDKYKKILIMGDSGRGKTMLALKMSEILKIKNYCTDDFLYKIKFSLKEDKDESIKKILNIYKQDSWIVEGSTTYLLKPGIEYTDIIIYVEFRNLLHQWLSIIKRYLNKKDTSFLELIKFLIFIARKRYGIGYEGTRKKKKAALKDMGKKIIYLKSFKEINLFLEKLDN